MGTLQVGLVEVCPDSDIDEDTFREELHSGHSSALAPGACAVLPSSNESGRPLEQSW